MPLRIWALGFWAFIVSLVLFTLGSLLCGIALALGAYAFSAWSDGGAVVHNTHWGALSNSYTYTATSHNSATPPVVASNCF